MELKYFRTGKIAQEALSLKDNSIKQLKNEKVPYIEHLPVIDNSTEAKKRTKEEICYRAVALCIAAVKGEGLAGQSHVDFGCNNFSWLQSTISAFASPLKFNCLNLLESKTIPVLHAIALEGLEQDIVNSLILKYNIAPKFSPKEKAFMNNAEASQHDKVQFLWKYECYWVLLWALGYIDELSRPDSICNVQKAVSLLADRDIETFIQDAELRHINAILDQADLIYRYHWAVVDAGINGKEVPAGLDSGVVMERHYVLNWLIGYMGQSWDDISTDT